MAHRRKPTTIYDIAALAGTSGSAVSAILNDRWRARRISAELAERVQRIAREQGYARNRQATALRAQRSGMVGMIVPKYDNRYFGAIAEQFEQRARAAGLFPVVTCTQRDPGLEIAASRELIAQSVEVLVATGATDPDRITAMCRGAGVTALNLDLPGTMAPSVISDNFGGALALTRLLLDRCDAGRIGFVGGRAGDHNTGERLRGFRAALAERGLAASDDDVLVPGYGAPRVRAALQAVGGGPFAGLFVNSTIALEGVLDWRGRAAAGPQVVCFDWDPFAAHLAGGIPMMRQDVTGLLDALFRALADPAAAPLLTEVPTVLETP